MGGPSFPSLPPSFLMPLPTLASPSLALAAQVTQVPPDLAQLNAPLTINGTILSLFENGNLTVKTDQGIVELALLKTQTETLKLVQDFVTSATQDPTQPQKSVELVLQAGSPTKQAMLILPQGETQKTASKAEATLQPQAIAKTEAPFQKGQTLTVTVLPDEIDRDSIAVKSKTASQATFTAKTAEQPQAPHAGEHAASGNIDKTAKAMMPHASEESVTPPTMAGSTAKGAAHSLAPQTLRLRIDQVITPDEPWPHDIRPEQIKATIISKSHSGHALIESEGKTIFVHNAGGLPAGTKIVATRQAGGASGTTPLPFSQEQDFTPMREFVSALIQTDLPAAAHFIQTRLPSPTHHLAGTAMFLLSVLQSGKIDEWLGEPLIVKMERAGKKQATSDLMKAMEEPSLSPVRDAQVGEWRAYPLPLHHGTAFEMLRLYVHHDAQHGRRDEVSAIQDKRTRFVITMNMSNLGSLQLDGLSQHKKLDLVIRSEAPLPDSLTRELRDTTVKTLEATGLIGSILFQTGRQNWVVFQSAEQKEWVT
ncbi:MAG: hypothetical protein WC612_06495 [Bdellovibrionales bacterium]|jgi:hypothetical protein